MRCAKIHSYFLGLGLLYMVYSISSLKCIALFVATFAHRIHLDVGKYQNITIVIPKYYRTTFSHSAQPLKRRILFIELIISEESKKRRRNNFQNSVSTRTVLLLGPKRWMKTVSFNLFMSNDIKYFEIYSSFFSFCWTNECVFVDRKRRI